MQIRHPSGCHLGMPDLFSFTSIFSRTNTTLFPENFIGKALNIAEPLFLDHYPCLSVSVDTFSPIFSLAAPLYLDHHLTCLCGHSPTHSFLALSLVSPPPPPPPPRSPLTPSRVALVCSYVLFSPPLDLLY